MEDESIIKKIESLKQMIQTAKHIPLSNLVAIDKEKYLVAIEQIENSLPSEVKEAYLIYKRKSAILKKANEERERILETARSRRDEIVQNSDILREAKEEREKIIAEAQQEAERIEKEAEDYAFKLLSKVEAILEKAQAAVRQGKEDLKDESSDSTDLA